MATEPTETEKPAANETAAPALPATAPEAAPDAAPWWKALPWASSLNWPARPDLSWSGFSWSGLSWPGLSWPGAAWLPSLTALRPSSPPAGEDGKPAADRDAPPAGRTEGLMQVWAGSWPLTAFRLAGEVTIETATDADLPYMADIHALSFAQVWSEDEIAALLATPGTFALVARRASPFGTRRPVGFMIVRAAAGEAEVLTIAVDPARRGGGIGSRLTAEALRRLYAERAEAVFLEVDSENAAALAVYRRQGFVQVGLRRGYYAHAAGHGHALVLRRDLR